MIYCSCTGVNTSTLKEAIENGATRLSQVYNLAKEKNETSSRCTLPEQRNVCTESVAKAWAELFPDDIPASVQKVIDKSEKKKGSCGNSCATCPNKDKKGDIVTIFDPKAVGDITHLSEFSCETGVTRDQNGTQISPQKLVADG